MPKIVKRFNGTTWDTIDISVDGASFGSQTARYALIAPDTNGIPTFRALTIADISDISSASVSYATDSGTSENATYAANADYAAELDNGITFNNSGSGATSGTSFNGSEQTTISYNTIGAASSGHIQTVAAGGTNITSYSAGDILYASGSTVLSKLSKGAAGESLKMNSGATAPEWGLSKAYTSIANFTAGTTSNGTTAVALASTRTFASGDVIGLCVRDTLSASGGLSIVWIQLKGTGTSYFAGGFFPKTSAGTGMTYYHFEVYYSGSTLYIDDAYVQSVSTGPTYSQATTTSIYVYDLLLLNQ